MGIIVSAFIGCGKEDFIANKPEFVRVYDCGSYIEGMDLEEYCQKAISSVESNDIVFISYNNLVRERLSNLGVDFDTFIPSKDKRLSILEQLVKDGIPMSTIAIIDRNFDDTIDEFIETNLEHEYVHLLVGPNETLLNNELIIKYIESIRR